MGELLSIDELRQAERNLVRLRSFFVQRAEWTVDRGGLKVLENIERAADGIAGSLQHLTNGTPPTDSSAADDGETLAPADFDNPKLTRFAAFLEQLDVWFRSHLECPVEDGGAGLMTDMAGSVRTIQETLATVLDRSRPKKIRRTADATPSQPIVPPPPNPDLDTGEFEPPPKPRPEAATERLVLCDTDEDPLLQTFRGEVELTFEAKEKLSKFLESHGVSMSSYHLRKFEDDVKRRIEGTPEGQVLVVKVGGIKGDPSPYFAYVARSTMVES